MSDREARKCPQCGKDITVDARKNFCSRKCNREWWHAKGIADGTERADSRKCGLPDCDVIITNRRRLYCTDEHSVRAKAENRDKIPPSQREKEVGELRCAWCGEPPPRERALRSIGHGWRAFCDEKHQRKFFAARAWEKHLLKTYGSLKPTEKRCAYRHCGKSFTPKSNRERAYRDFCSMKCSSRERAALEMQLECDLCDGPINRQERPYATTCSDKCRDAKISLMRSIVELKKNKRERPEVL